MPIIKQFFIKLQNQPSHQRCSIKKGFRKNSNFHWTGITCVEVSFGTRLKQMQQRCFPVNIAKFLATTVLKNIYIRLLLKIIKSIFLGKATSHNDHYMINMGGQGERPKIGSNLLLTSPYL